VVTLLDESIGMLLQLNVDLKIRKGEHPIEGTTAFTACKLWYSPDPWRYAAELEGILIQDRSQHDVQEACPCASDSVVQCQSDPTREKQDIRSCYS
jgi:hypothetical protein